MLPLLERLPGGDALIRPAHRLLHRKRSSRTALGPESARRPPPHRAADRASSDRSSIAAACSSSPGTRRRNPAAGAPWAACPAPGGGGDAPRHRADRVSPGRRWRGTSSRTTIRGDRDCGAARPVPTQDAGQDLRRLDYAEGQIDRLRAVANAAARGRGWPAHLSLPSRGSAVGRWDSSRASAVPAPSLAAACLDQWRHSLASRAQTLYAMARQDFGASLAARIDAAVGAAADLAGDDYFRPLGVWPRPYFRRLAVHCRRGPLRDPVSAGAAHWRRRQRRARRRRKVDELARAATRRHWPGPSEEGVKALIWLMAVLASYHRPDIVRGYARVLTAAPLQCANRTCHRTARCFGPIEPDLLGEHVGRCACQKDRSTAWLSLPCGTALAGAPLYPQASREILAVVGAVYPTERPTRYVAPHTMRSKRWARRLAT